jgi:hypothetical protein
LLTGGTFINWTSPGAPLFQLEALLQLLERLPESEWRGLLGRFLRACPTIESPAFGHELTTVSRLRLLLREKRGMTFIQGGSDVSRTTLFTALARSFLQMSVIKKSALSGIDLHVPDWFVPVENLVYLPPLTDRNKMALGIEKGWREANEGRWRMFNGVWSLVPDHQRKLLIAAESRHVVVSDTTAFSVSQLRKIFKGARCPIRLLNLSETSPDRIQVEFQEA